MKDSLPIILPFVAVGFLAISSACIPRGSSSLSAQQPPMSRPFGLLGSVMASSRELVPTPVPICLDGRGEEQTLRAFDQWMEGVSSLEHAYAPQGYRLLQVLGKASTDPNCWHTDPFDVFPMIVQEPRPLTDIELEKISEEMSYYTRYQSALGGHLPQDLCQCQESFFGHSCELRSVATLLNWNVRPDTGCTEQVCSDLNHTISDRCKKVSIVAGRAMASPPKASRVTGRQPQVPPAGSNTTPVSH